MDVDQIWAAIDAERSSLADLLEDLSPSEWRTPPLCDAWRVGDVAAHLTLAHAGYRDVFTAALRARGNFDRMIRDEALRAASLPQEEYPRRLRAMLGSRRTAPFLTPKQPLLDVLVHGQDITVPLGRSRPMPAAAAAVAAQAAWDVGFPFRARRRLAGLRLTATDADWTVGSGAQVEGPIAALLLLLTGRQAALDQLTGDGVRTLRRREEMRRPS
ncbi:maleylpyruvate isomerase family mycothiol-dependent enzyme [Blastococcus sp. PRF04-17]|uniref:maleylpyruvate isomerase family mycothiol-dependent enzyme n=1 Tax=Blastococcus sp. PRF04-17 TaxID=2933797 RepID=UPI001FF54DBD|nr:maleylpyruvate isomerase family mycothiol-dependent enzyme [Blastococcus sp. PRF04-17]UOY03327.1 maleylpyruvate isomerase family mycothiol-dependent enzyme [Blastococcus sp. PRF04-17]